MGLFHNYLKPGPGVDKNAPEKKPFFKFWDLFFRKFMQYIILNALYLLIILPVVVSAYVLLYASVYYQAGITANDVALPPMLEMCVFFYSVIPQTLHIPLFALSLLLYGPFTMGLTYILRNFAREEHAWISDFFTRSFRNWKQGLFFGVLDILIVFVVAFNWFNGTEAFGLVGVAIQWFTLIFGIYYFFMRFYNYQQAVTIELGVFKILRNSAIFGVLGLWRNILATICILAVFVLSTLVYPLLEIVLMPFVTFSLCGFIGVFCTYPIMRKYILSPEALSEESSSDETDELVLPPELGGPGAGALGMRDDIDENKKTPPGEID